MKVMNTNKKWWLCLPVIILLSIAVNGSATTSLLDNARIMSKQDAWLNQERERVFRLSLEEQTQLLEKITEELAVAEAEQAQLKARFESNEDVLADLETTLRQRMGTLGEVFGVAKEAAMELAPLLEDSVTSAELPARAKVLTFAETKRIPRQEDLTALNQEFLAEMVANGRIAQFSAEVINAAGEQETQQVTRYGMFAATNHAGDYLHWDVAQQRLIHLSTQPSASARASAHDFIVGRGESVLLDPTRGELLALLDRMPSLVERIKQSGEVGFIIIVLGVIGLLIALLQMLRLLRTELRVRSQLKNTAEPNSGNPLGRVLLSARELTQLQEPSSGQAVTTIEQLELKVDEAIIKEIPAIEQGHSFLKLLAAVAPLLGLLGTVVGMIATFQSITLFGTSDPKLMANGISQALVTTVLGLVVAVPVLFCHSLLVARGRRLIQILQEKSLAALADSLPLRTADPGDQGEVPHVA